MKVQKYFMRTRMHGTPTGRPDYGQWLTVAVVVSRLCRVLAGWWVLGRFSTSSLLTWYSIELTASPMTMTSPRWKTTWRLITPASNMFSLLIFWCYSKTGCDGIGMCCEKKTLIGWRNVWNMWWRAPDQEVDQRGHGERLCKKIANHSVWTGRMLWIVVDGRSWWGLGDDQDGGWVNVSSGTGSPG